MKTTILQRKNWLLSRYSSDGLPDLYRIENVKTWFCDHPARNSQGALSYDFPERIPAYVQDLCRRCIPDERPITPEDLATKYC